MNEIDKLDASILITASPVQDEAQVGCDHLLLCFVIACGDALSKFDLLLVIGHGVAVEITKQETQGIRAGGGLASGAVHGYSFRLQPAWGGIGLHLTFITHTVVGVFPFEGKTS